MLTLLFMISQFARRLGSWAAACGRGGQPVRAVRGAAYGSEALRLTRVWERAATPKLDFLLSSAGPGPSGSGLEPCLQNPARLVKEVLRALDQGEFSLYYQPKIDARTGHVAGAEGLLRWTGRQGPVPPVRDIISALEQSGEIQELTDWAIATASRDIDYLRGLGHAVRLAVNLSATTIGQADFVQRVISRAGNNARCMTLEITETAILEAREQACRNLKDLAAAGFQLALDDYGAGYSSLSQLQDLPLHELKIDKGFINGLSESHRGPLIVRSTIELAHALEMEVVAEGIETAETMALLSVMGCDRLQGFLLSRAIPVDQLAAFISSGAGTEKVCSRLAPGALMMKLAAGPAA